MIDGKNVNNDNDKSSRIACLLARWFVVVPVVVVLVIACDIYVRAMR